MVDSLRELALWLLVSVGLYLALAVVTYTPYDPGWSHSNYQGVLIQNAGGWLGAWCADVLVNLFGYLALLLPLTLIWHAVMVLYYGNDTDLERLRFLPVRWLGFSVTLGSGAILLDLYVRAQIIPMPSGPGGVLGQYLAPLALALLTPLGGVLLTIVAFVIGFTLLSNISWLKTMEAIGRFILGFLSLPFLPIIRFLRK